MATHGGSEIRRWLLGSVANKLLQEASNDIFLIPVRDEGKTGGAAMLKRVILPLDGSPFAEQVLPYIQRLAKKIGLKVVLLRVCVFPPPLTKNPYSPSMNVWELHQYLGDKVQELLQKGLNDVEPMVKSGYAAEQIICTAGKPRDSFVAMCTHGGLGMNRWDLGSVTNTVVRHSRGPVLVIRGRTSIGGTKQGSAESTAAACVQTER
ncbi:MAG: universal stress protein, partial [Pyrinomonadaceae bacterium]